MCLKINRWDFEDVVLQQPTAAQTATGAEGQCGGTDGDSIVIASPSTDIVGFESLCGTLTGQHSKSHLWIFSLENLHCKK